MHRLFLVLSCCLACITESPELAARNAHARYRDADLPFGRPDHELDISRSRFSIEGVTAGKGEDEVRQALGAPPESDAPQEGEEHTYVEWRYPGIRITFDRHRVNSVVCSAPASCATAAGVRLGDLHEVVTRAYGPGFRGFQRGNDALLYYAIGRPDCVLEFDFTDDKISRIYYSCGLPVPDLDNR